MLVIFRNSALDCPHEKNAACAEGKDDGDDDGFDLIEAREDVRAEVLAIIFHVAQLIKLVDVPDLREIFAWPHHEFLKQRPFLNRPINPQAPHKFVIDKGIVDVGVVAAIELDEIGGDVVAVDDVLEGVGEDCADDVEGEPIVGAEDAIDSVFRGDGPHLVVLDCISGSF